MQPADTLLQRFPVCFQLFQTALILLSLVRTDHNCQKYTQQQQDHHDKCCQKTKYMLL